MAVFKNVTLTKRDLTVPVYQLVKGDRATSGIRLNISRYDGGVDLGALGWCVKVVNANGDDDVIMFTPTVGDAWVIFDWVFPAIVAAKEGLCCFEVEAVNSANSKVWQSGKRYVSVVDDLDAEPGYDEDALSDFERTVSTVGVKVAAMGASVDGYEARITAAVNAANASKTAADTAASGANTAKAAANTAAANATSIYNTVSAKLAAGELKGAKGDTGATGAAGADGVDGSSVTCSTSEITGGHRVTLTDKDGAHSFDVMDGVGGDGSGSGEVTAEAIAEALGYTAADEDDVEEIEGRLDGFDENLTELAGNVDYVTESITTLQGQVAGKQDSITDLDTIRSKANSALQEHQDISGKADKTALDIFKSSEIRRINDVSEKLKQSRFIGGTSGVKPLSIIHFSDIHRDTDALARIVSDAELLGDYIDDIVCTGDMSSNSCTEQFDWWNDSVLTCIGNHDTGLYSNGSYDWTSMSISDRYNKYIAPFASEWGAVTLNGKSYYYKDYTESKVRIIVIDAMLYTGTSNDETTAQNTWLGNILDSAIANNLHVIICTHAPHANSVPVKCGFTEYGTSVMPYEGDCTTPDSVITLVGSKITAGLKFIGYLCGHTHRDTVWDANNDKKQYMYAVSCASTNSVQYRMSDISHDGNDVYNIVTVDTTRTLIKIIRCGKSYTDRTMRSRDTLCIDYSTGSIVNETTVDSTSSSEKWVKIIDETVSSTTSIIRYNMSSYPIGSAKDYSKIMVVVDTPAIGTGYEKCYVRCGFGWDDSTPYYGLIPQSVDFGGFDWSKADILRYNIEFVDGYIFSEFSHRGYGTNCYPMQKFATNGIFEPSTSSAKYLILSSHIVGSGTASFPEGAKIKVYLRM